MLMSAPQTVKESHRYRADQLARRYDPAVIHVLEGLIAYERRDEVEAVRVSAVRLREGMVLTRDVMHPDGFMLLSKNTPLTHRLIDQLVTGEKDAGCSLDVFGSMWI
jgi:hypothetical protein